MNLFMAGLGRASAQAGLLVLLVLLAQRLSSRHRRSHSPGIYRPSCLCSVTGEGLVVHPRVHVDPGDVAVVVLEHPVIHHVAPQWREVVSAIIDAYPLGRLGAPAMLRSVW